MAFVPSTIIVQGIKASLDASNEEVYIKAKKVLLENHISSENLSCHIHRKSVDARKKDQVCFVYSIAVSGLFENKKIEQLKNNPTPQLQLQKNDELTCQYGSQLLNEEIIVVGSGPCGLFCGYLLAKNGYRPHIIERGGTVQERKEALELFFTTRKLDPDTNVQFGAGGAGTFSDGKLVTRINDPLEQFILQTFVSFGAPEEILYQAKPHIGTDILSVIVQRMVDEIEKLGGKVSFHTKLVSINKQNNKVVSIQTNKGVLPCSNLVLALGNSSRDTFQELLKEGFSLEPKSFSVGVRVEHLQSKIDRALYGSFANHPNLGHAEYHLSYDTKNRGVYSFCMCPGGQVMAATSEEESVVVNGMSYHKRDGKNANSAIVVSIRKEDYGCDVLKAIEYQRTIEKKAFIAGGKDYSVPLITMGDFLSDQLKTEPSSVEPTYMNGQAYRLASPYSYLPSVVCEQLKGAFVSFEKQIQGFSAKEALLSGAETRTSSPLRILRNNQTYSALGFSNMYPCGEGAGYAGGITSAAIDGLHCALCIMKEFKPYDVI